MWSNWTEYSMCNATCDGVFKIRSRNCSNPMPANGGDLCKLSNSEIPVKSDYEEECVRCNEFPCNGKYILEDADLKIGKTFSGRTHT